MFHAWLSSQGSAAGGAALVPVKPTFQTTCRPNGIVELIHSGVVNVAKRQSHTCLVVLKQMHRSVQNEATSGIMLPHDWHAGSHRHELLQQHLTEHTCHAGWFGWLHCRGVYTAAAAK